MNELSIKTIGMGDRIAYRLRKTKLGMRRLESRLGMQQEIPDHRFGLAACLVFRDEADYLKEWLLFHEAVGFEHFYLYDNNSTDDWLSQIPKRMLEENKVTATRIGIKNPQFLAYNHCLNNARGVVRWLAFLDADEYLYTTQRGGALMEFLGNFPDAPGIAVNWQMFGCGGHISRPEGSVLKNFKKCAASGNRHVKVIVRPERTLRIANPHEAKYLAGDVAVNERNAAVTGPRSEPPSIEKIRINHYWTKSVEEFFLKKIKRGDPMGGQRSAMDLIEHERRCVDDSDDEAIRFAVPSE